MDEFSYPPHPSTSAQPVITEKTIVEDARVGSVLTASMEDHFATDIMEFERTHQI
jgi:hypothetical protein